VAEKLPKGVRRRGGVLWVSVSKDGRRLRRSGGRTLDDALQIRAELLSEIGLAPPLRPAMESKAPAPVGPKVSQLLAPLATALGSERSRLANVSAGKRVTSLGFADATGYGGSDLVWRMGSHGRPDSRSVKGAQVFARRADRVPTR